MCQHAVTRCWKPFCRSSQMVNPLYRSCPILWPCGGETSSHRIFRESLPQQKTPPPTRKSRVHTLRWRDRGYPLLRAGVWRGVSQPPHCCHGLRTRGGQGRTEHQSTWQQPIHCSSLHVPFTLTKPSLQIKREMHAILRNFILVGCILLRYVHEYLSNIYPRSQLRTDPL
jgi:hypothetical protein